MSAQQSIDGTDSTKNLPAGGAKPGDRPADRRDRSCGCCVGCFLIALALAVAAWMLLDPGSQRNRSTALSTTQEWARLAPFPVPASDIKIETTGSMFTREFVVEFEASPADIRKWLADSPGTRDAQPEVAADGSLHYVIKPGGGAQFAELWVSSDGKRVRIRTYWS